MPFRVNLSVGKDQGLPPFVHIKAVFLPHRDAFGFVELLSEPQEQAPRFLKARKEDKAKVQKSSSKRSIYFLIPLTFVLAATGKHNWFVV